MENRWDKLPHDFEAVIRIYCKEEGGRIEPPPNGILWNFAYKGDDINTVGCYMIYPNFIDDHGNSLPTDKPLPVDKKLNARMYILSEEMKNKVHSKRISVGQIFYCHEGTKPVAEGIVTKVTGLKISN